VTLNAQQISLAIRGKPILHNVDFTAHSGAVTAIAGPNGSGKTTLLRAMINEEAATGQITLNGIPVTPRTAATLAATRAVLPQSSRIAFPFKVAEVIRIGHLAGPHAHHADIADRALEAVGLSGYQTRFFQELSGGEQQRVQLARVLCQVWQPMFEGQPRWLFLDEPVASLDIGHQLGIMQLVRDYADQGGGVVAVMHDLNLTAMFADRVTIMKSGRVLAEGTPPEVMTNEILSRTYDADISANSAPGPGTPFVLPQMAAKRCPAERPSRRAHHLATP